ncbi:unnamed protein product [Prunus armeniaca]
MLTSNLTADTIEKENPPTDIIERESSAKSADANSGQDEKRPNAPIQGDSPAGNIMPSQTFLRPRKVPPNTFHLKETQPSVLEKEIGVQIMTSVGDDELAEINTTEHPERLPTCSKFSTDTTAIEAEFQPLFVISSDPPSTCPLKTPRSGPTFQADVVESTVIMVNHAIVTSGAPSTIPTDGSAPHEPVLMLTSGAPALVVNATPSKLQLEIGESSSFVPVEITMTPSAEDGRSLAMVLHEEALLPSPNQPSGDIFDFLDQWDAFISSVEAFTRLATSSTTTGTLPDSGAEALLRSYRDGDLMSLEDKDERNKLKTAIESLASYGFFPDPRSAAMITYLFGQVQKFAPRRHPFLEEQRMGPDLE